MAGKGGAKAKTGGVSGRKRAAGTSGPPARRGQASREAESRSPELIQLLQWMEERAVHFRAHLREGERRMAEVQREIAELRKAVGRARVWKQVLERKQREVAEQLEQEKAPSQRPEPGEDRLA